MRRIDSRSVIDMDLTIHWRSGDAAHEEVYRCEEVNIWRDLLPKTLFEKLHGKTAGERFQFRMSAGEIVGGYDHSKIFTVSTRQFNRDPKEGEDYKPREGRFYPKGLLSGIAGVYPQSIEPFRVVRIEDDRLTVDFNHPMAGKEAEIAVEITGVDTKAAERGGVCRVWLEEALKSVGMQARWDGIKTDFFSDRPFEREDESPDRHFYERPRIVDHIDEAAEDAIRRIYGRFVHSGSRVLDLMSSWVSHLPENVDPECVTGLGMNAGELQINDVLGERLVQDLNLDPKLPFRDGAFDYVVCTVSVEYLTRPMTIFSELYRVLKSGGGAIMTFSNRWFSPKAVRIWKELSDFERMGLVTEYFLSTDGFEDLKTISVRGYPRPTTDKYFPQLKRSDPVYAVIGKRK